MTRDDITRKGELIQQNIRELVEHLKREDVSDDAALAKFMIKARNTRRLFKEWVE